MLFLKISAFLTFWLASYASFADEDALTLNCTQKPYTAWCDAPLKNIKDIAAKLWQDCVECKTRGKQPPRATAYDLGDGRFLLELSQEFSALKKNQLPGTASKGIKPTLVKHFYLLKREGDSVILRRAPMQYRHWAEDRSEWTDLPLSPLPEYGLSNIAYDPATHVLTHRVSLTPPLEMKWKLAGYGFTLENQGQQIGGSGTGKDVMIKRANP